MVAVESGAFFFVLEKCFCTALSNVHFIDFVILESLVVKD